MTGNLNLQSNASVGAVAGTTVAIDGAVQGNIPVPVAPSAPSTLTKSGRARSRFRIPTPTPEPPM